MLLFFKTKTCIQIEHSNIKIIFITYLKGKFWFFWGKFAVAKLYFLLLLYKKYAGKQGSKRKNAARFSEYLPAFHRRTWSKSTFSACGVRALLTSAFAPQSFLPYSIQIISTKQAEKNQLMARCLNSTAHSAQEWPFWSEKWPFSGGNTITWRGENDDLGSGSPDEGLRTTDFPHSRKPFPATYPPTYFCLTPSAKHPFADASSRI